MTRIEVIISKWIDEDKLTDEELGRKIRGWHGRKNSAEEFWMWDDE